MFKNLNIKFIQVRLFLLTIAVYAIFGQPTPEKIGVVEIIIAIGLIASIGFSNFLGTLTIRPLFEKGREDFEKIASIAFSSLIIIPTIIGLFNGSSFTLILRDIIPLMYSFIPLFMYHKLSQKEVSRLYYICMFSGVILALRFLHISEFSWSQLGNRSFHDYNMYLAISPFILFATLFLFLDFFEDRNWIKKVLMIFYAVICAGAILATSQRASAGAGVFFAVLYLLNKSRKNMHYMVGGILSFIAIYYLCDDYIITSFDMLVEKTKAVGSNSRIAELTAVISEIKDSIFRTLFGHGWGYKFYSPAVNEKVGFTHNMFSYFLLKTGFVGLIVYLTYIGSILSEVFYKNKNLNFISYACLPPLLISMTLYTGYKYFDFGCLLLVLLVTKHIPITLSMKRQEIIERFKVANLDNPVLDSGIIIQKILGISKTMMFIEGDRVLTHHENRDINKLVKRRLKNEPIARIENSKEFWGLEFKLNKDTLVPRPDSESVIESILENYNKSDKLRILDLGTGSGCLLLSTLSEFPNATGVGADLSPNAVKQARENAKALGLKDRSVFVQSNWFSHFKNHSSLERCAESVEVGESKRVSDSEARLGGGNKYKFDIIISNPPYVKRAEKLSKEVFKYDPHLALFAEDDGLKCYEDISKEVDDYLKSGGKVFFEIGVGQKTKVSCFMKKAGLDFYAQKKDLGGHIRCLVFKKKEK